MRRPRAHLLNARGQRHQLFTQNDCAVGGLVWTGIGPAIGVGIDALVKGDITVMKAPAPGAKTRVSVAPVVQRERRGVVFTIGF